MNKVELKNNYEITCLEGNPRLRSMVAKQMEKLELLAEDNVDRNNLLYIIEAQAADFPLALKETLRCRSFQLCDKAFFMCSGSFAKHTTTLVTADVTIPDILRQSLGKAKLSTATMGSHDALFKSLSILTKLPEHDHVVNILAYQNTRLPRYFVCSGIMDISLAEVLYTGTHISGKVPTVAKLLKIAAQAVSSIQHCHKYGIILRNISPAMFFVTGDEIQLADASYAIEENTTGSKFI